MKVELGKTGLDKSWQAAFPEETKCSKCSGSARIGFVAHEIEDEAPFVCDLHKNDPISKKNPDAEGYWLHDCCAVAVYFCRKCLSATAISNQG